MGSAFAMVFLSFGIIVPRLRTPVNSLPRKNRKAPDFLRNPMLSKEGWEISY
jgi:hypothetical protein